MDERFDPMKTILLAIDFSEGIENCCSYAVRVASRFEAEIILFHSYFDKFLVAENNFPTGIEADTLINRKILDDIKTQAEADLKNIEGCIVEAHPEAKVKSALSGGNPEEEILNAAALYDVDLIMLGSSGKAVKGIFSGSVSKKIIENTTIPVLSIPLHYTYKDINNVMYPTELMPNDPEIIELIFDILSKFSFKMHCLHLVQPGKMTDTGTLENLESHFSDAIKKDLICVEVLESDNFTESLERYVEKNQIDMISFVAHKRGFLKELFTQKLTKKDLFQLKLPMLTIKR